MEINYEEYEKSCEEIRAANNRLLELFRDSLSGLKPGTARRHVENAELYINSYLLYEEPLTFEHGVSRIDDYLGYYFIRRFMWSTPGTIRSAATGIKKFYKCMLDHGKIRKEDYDFLCEEIRYGLPKWQADCAQYNDPEEDSPFDFF